MNRAQNHVVSLAVTLQVASFDLPQNEAFRSASRFAKVMLSGACVNVIHKALPELALSFADRVGGEGGCL